MTKEELKNKCTERAKIFQQAMESCHSSSPMDCIEWFADRIADLEKENAELKERADEEDLDSVIFFNQLCKAKQFIRDFLSVAIDYIDKEDKNYSLITEAEQFLSEVANG